MESPPPYYSPAPKKSNVGLIVAIVLGVVCVCCILPCAGLGGLGYFGWNKVKGMVGCSITFANLQQAIRSYSEAHDGKLPKAATWQTDIHSYYEKEVAKNEQAAKMFSNGPADAVGCTNGESPATGIAFNSELSGKKVSDLKDPMSTVMLFEVPQSGSNLNEKYTPQPFETSPKMLNSQRGWYVCEVSGNVALISRNGRQSPVNMGTNPGG